MSRRAESLTHGVVHVNSQGRVTIPVALRSQLGISSKTPVIAYIDSGRLVFEPRASLVARLQREARASRCGDSSVSGELIADRRLEAQREHDDRASDR